MVQRVLGAKNALMQRIALERRMSLFGGVLSALIISGYKYLCLIGREPGPRQRENEKGKKQQNRSELPHDLTFLELNLLASQKLSLPSARLAGTGRREDGWTEVEGEKRKQNQKPEKPKEKVPKISI